MGTGDGPGAQAEAKATGRITKISVVAMKVKLGIKPQATLQVGAAATGQKQAIE
jgi:hypothetical protein